LFVFLFIWRRRYIQRTKELVRFEPLWFVLYMSYIVVRGIILSATFSLSLSLSTCACLLFLVSYGGPHREHPQMLGMLTVLLWCKDGDRICLFVDSKCHSRSFFLYLCESTLTLRRTTPTPDTDSVLFPSLWKGIGPFTDTWRNIWT